MKTNEIKNKKCIICGAVKDDVRVRECSLKREIYAEKVMERICDDCEEAHKDDI